VAWPGLATAAIAYAGLISLKPRTCAPQCGAVVAVVAAGGSGGSARTGRLLLELDEAEQDDEQRRLAGARAPDDADFLARPDLEVDVAQHQGQLRAVAERDVLEAHHALLGPRASGHAALVVLCRRVRIKNR